MALTDTENMYNLALGYVGEFQIQDTSDSRQTKQYELCTRYYALARNMILKRHRWDEATEYVMIRENATKPLFNYASRFALPSDSIQIQSISRNSIGGQPGMGDIMPWQVAGNYILTNNQESPSLWQVDVDYPASVYVNDTVVAWETGRVYLANQVASYGGTSYSVATAHTASALNRPDVDDATYWTNRGNISESTYLCKVLNTSTTSTRPNT